MDELVSTDFNNWTSIIDIFINLSPRGTFIPEGDGAKYLAL